MTIINQLNKYVLLHLMYSHLKAFEIKYRFYCTGNYDTVNSICYNFVLWFTCANLRNICNKVVKNFSKFYGK